jgi:glucokinase
MKSFASKGRFSKLMMSMPVKVILNDRASLFGAYHYAILHKD